MPLHGLSIAPRPNVLSSRCAVQACTLLYLLSAHALYCHSSDETSKLILANALQPPLDEVLTGFGSANPDIAAVAKRSTN